MSLRQSANITPGTVTDPVTGCCPGMWMSRHCR